MPPNNFTDFQAGTILAYLRSAATSGPTSAANGNAARGKAIFEGKGGCAGCHRVYGVGSRVGPDLSDIGALRRVAEIELSVLDPNAEVLPQNRYYRVTTKKGETHHGAAAERRRILGAVAGFQGTAALVSADGSSFGSILERVAHAVLSRQVERRRKSGRGHLPGFVERVLRDETEFFDSWADRRNRVGPGLLRPDSEGRQRAAELADLFRHHDEPALHYARSDHAAEREEPGIAVDVPSPVARKIRGDAAGGRRHLVHRAGAEQCGCAGCRDGTRFLDLCLRAGSRRPSMLRAGESRTGNFRRHVVHGHHRCAFGRHRREKREADLERDGRKGGGGLCAHARSPDRQGQSDCGDRGRRVWNSRFHRRLRCEDRQGRLALLHHSRQRRDGQRFLERRFLEARRRFGVGDRIV